jgi:hypothetical protein
VSAAAISVSASLIFARVASNACCDSLSRDRASATISPGSPRRSAIAKACDPPGSPIVSRYVGESDSRSNSTDAFRAAAVVWA